MAVLPLASPATASAHCPLPSRNYKRCPRSTQHCKDSKYPPIEEQTHMVHCGRDAESDATALNGFTDFTMITACSSLAR